MKIGLLLAALALGACSTTSHLRAQEPTWTFTSAKSPEEYRDCLLKDYAVDMNVSAYQDAILMTRTGTGPAGNFLEIRQDAKGSKVDVFGQRGIRIRAERCV